MRKVILLLALLAAALPLAAAGNLQIYFVDVEGGQATLIVSPSGQSMLVDAGWPGFGGRDADRIVAAAKAAGVKQIDYMLMTHYHVDHVGGIPPLAEKIPIMHFIDHGPNNETDPMAKRLEAAYDALLKKGDHTVVKPGDKIPLKGVDIEVVAANGERIEKPLAGAGAPNPVCAEVKPKANDPTENARSIGFLLRYGKFRFVDMGDLTWNKEIALMCPNNPIGTTDVYLITHHGMDLSNSPVIVDALHPRVAIENNGARKGGSPSAWQVVRNSPGLEDIWQLHFSNAGGKTANAPEQFIANPTEPCQGHYLKLTAEANGAFTVTNSRNDFSKTYKPR
jgi:competence protein ComEC